jgi:hypothetical protein
MRALVDNPAVFPDLAGVACRLDLDAGHLHHGRLVLFLPQAGNESVVTHHLASGRRGEQRVVGREEHLLGEDVLVVLAVELCWRHDGGVRRALSDARGELRVHVGWHGESVGDEGGAVGAPESTTMSSSLRPFTLKLWTSWDRLKVGGARKSRAREEMETRPSRRPTGMSKSTLRPLRRELWSSRFESQSIFHFDGVVNRARRGGSPFYKSGREYRCWSVTLPN